MKIDIDLIKKKSEHNEGLLEELEEIALHQLQIKKIECLNIYCKNLKILLLQHNLIDKIENLKQLKKLEYLNLALNNITVIENLNQCESLKKLDLTLNFIDIMSIEISINNLKSNKNLRELYLMGNPCMKWKYCMYYVIYELPQLEYFDGSEIVASHRIKSKQLYKHILASLEEEKKIFQRIPDASFDCIKSRKEIYEEVEKENEKEAMKNMDSEKNIEKKEISSIFTKDGEIRQCNEGQYKFMFDEYSSNKYSFLKLYLPKYLCNSLIEIDLNIHYFRCVVNKKVFQIKFHDPILTDCSKISRKKYTGELCVKMRKENYKKNKIVENRYLNNNSDFLSLEHYNSLSSSDSDSRSSTSSGSSFFKNKRFPFQEQYKKNRFHQRKREKRYKMEKEKEKEKELRVNSLLDQKREDDFLIEEKERKYYSSILNQLPPLQKIQKG